MKTLYIVGNGFDRAHKIDTDYWNFREYLKDNAEEFLWRLENIYGFYPVNEDHIYSAEALERATKAWENNLYGKLWKFFEDRLGYPDEDDIESTCHAAINAMGDIEFGGIEDTLNQHFEEQFGFIEELQIKLFDWVKCIDLSNAKKQRDIEISDLFLTFNYTPVLEKIYGIDPSRICHIHGGVPPYCLTPPVIGHGNKKPIEQYEKLQKECDEVFDEGGSSMNRAFANFYRRTLKDTDRYICQNWRFFEKANDVDEIQVIGHSLGEVDMPYFNAFPTDIPWIIYYHSENDKATFEKTIRGIGVTDVAMKPSAEFWE